MKDLDVIEGINDELEGPMCLHCDTMAALTNGREVYPHRRDLWQKPIWKCPNCDAYCGCHPRTIEPLGRPADKPTRIARMKLHNEMLDPLWKRERTKGGHKKKKKPRFRRGELYLYLQDRMGLTADQAHTGLFTIEQCREAWKHLKKLRDGVETIT